MSRSPENMPGVVTARNAIRVSVRSHGDRLHHYAFTILFCLISNFIEPESFAWHINVKELQPNDPSDGD
jgi:hypothetical protein